jgi:tetratricopeptide (TPR) repeat protein
MNRNIFLILFSLIIINQNVYSQQLSKRELIDMEKRAHELYAGFNFHSAIPLYEKIHENLPNDSKIIYPLAVSYINEFDEENAFKYFTICMNEHHKYPDRIHYYMGKTQHLRHEFEDAIKHYQTFLSKFKNPKKFQSLIDDVNREIEQCQFAIEQMKSPVDLKVINIGDEINSEFPEYGPVLSADEKMLIFTSNRPNTTGGKIDPTDGKYFEDIYVSYKDEFGKWSKPVGMGPNINTDGHDASISITPDGQQLLIYRFNEAQGITGDLFISELEGEIWQPAKKLNDNINSKGWESSASLTEDGRIMYFTSSRPGGYGGTDIYMAKKLPNGEWALPMNLGPNINTPYDEDSPFMHPDGMNLYFSSRGHKGFGGHDIFVSTYNEETKTWGKPKNIGYPLNTAHDDMHFSWSVDGRRVYFAAKRADSKGDQDIYYAEINKDANHVLLMTGIIHEIGTKNMIGATIKVTDKATGQDVGVFHSNKTSGKFIIVFQEGKNYLMTIEADGYEDYQEDVTLADLHQYEESNRDFPLIKK